jgi:FkbM family methyltransferase
MKTDIQFLNILTNTLLQNIFKFHGKENWDEGRFGKRKAGFLLTLFDHILSGINSLLSVYGFRIVKLKNAADEFKNMMKDYGEGLCRLYEMLADEYSKRALVEILAYRILGYRHMKLWTNNSEYIKKRAISYSLPGSKETIATGIPHIRLSYYDLHQLGYPINLYTHPNVITHQFMIKNYAYNHITPPIWIASGDHVIDAGAAWGDTALLFAHEVGQYGKVYSFECEPTNVDILQKNFKLNPELAARISIISKALWRKSGETLSLYSKGPGTRVSKERNNSDLLKVKTISIDDFSKSLPRVNFIKMDIEGSELSALEGAKNTIRKFTPTLAISIYHSLSDFVNIPDYLKSLGVNYYYYIDHGSIHAEETILFATTKLHSKI